MAIKVCSLGSGSKGNCVLISDEKTHLLIDAGLSPVIIAKKLADFDLLLTDIDALLVTHEHDDHIKGVASLAQFMPVYSHPDTLEQILTKYPIPIKYLMDVEEGFSIGTMDIEPFDVSHDAAHPYGFCIKDWESKFTYMTDTGYVSAGAMALMRGSNTVMLESNHDTELLLRGKYPEYLKKRILSERGHLCNDETALTALDLVKSGTEKIILAHISEHNNLPELAYWTTKQVLKRELGEDARACALYVASQKETVIAE